MLSADDTSAHNALYSCIISVNDDFNMTNDAYAQLKLLSDSCTMYSILTGIIQTCLTLRATDALRTVYVAAYFTTEYVVSYRLML